METGDIIIGKRAKRARHYQVEIRDIFYIYRTTDLTLVAWAWYYLMWAELSISHF